MTTAEALDVVREKCGKKVYAVLIDCIAMLEIRCGDRKPPPKKELGGDSEHLAAAVGQVKESKAG